MRKSLALAFCSVLLFATTVRAQNPRKDEQAIRALAAQWQQDWSRGNSKALSALLSVDADYVTMDGSLLQGRVEFEDWRAHIQPAEFQHSSWTNTTLTFRFIQPEIAILHLTWTISAGHPQIAVPAETRSGISTWLLIKLGNGWKIRAAQDTQTRRLPQ